MTSGGRVSKKNLNVFQRDIMKYSSVNRRLKLSRPANSGIPARFQSIKPINRPAILGPSLKMINTIMYGKRNNAAILPCFLFIYISPFSYVRRILQCGGQNIFIYCQLFFITSFISFSRFSVISVASLLLRVVSCAIVRIGLGALDEKRDTAAG